MTEPSNETSKTLRHRSLRFMNQSKTFTDYELPSLRAKPRRKQNRGSDSDNNSNMDADSDDGTSDDSENNELSDSSSEGSASEQDSDGSSFSADEDDDLDNEEELATPSRSRDRQRRLQQRQLNDIPTSNNIGPSSSRSRKRQLGNDDKDSKAVKLNGNRSELTISGNENPNNHHPKRRKLRPSRTIRSTTIYNDLLSDDSEWMDQDIGIQYPSDMDIVMNDRRGKSTATSPLVLGSPSKVGKLQPSGDTDNSATLMSPDFAHHSRQSSSTSSTAHGASPLSKLDEKKWPRRPQASSFLDKLQAKEEDALDLSQHSFIPDDYLEPNHKSVSATTTMTTTGSRGSKPGQQKTLGTNIEEDSDEMGDSDDMAYQYDFSTISEPRSMAINPPSDTVLDHQGDTHTHQNNTNPPTPTPTPNTTEDEPRPPLGFFRRITRFFFG